MTVSELFKTIIDMVESGKLKLSSKVLISIVDSKGNTTTANANELLLHLDIFNNSALDIINKE